MNVALALTAAGLVVWAIGQNPLAAVRLLVDGAFGSALAWGYTLYYTTNFIFTGLAVAVAFHGGHFNIGAEGQATLGGLGAGLLMLSLDRWLPAPLLLPLAVLAGTGGRRRLGLRAGLAAGLPRQPHRHHDDHVQLPRLAR